MSILKDINIRPLAEEDIAQLEKWRREYWDADLEVPHGYMGQGVETAVAEKEGAIMASLTALQAIVLDPLVKNPSASHVDIVASIYLLERALSFIGQRWGAVDSYIAVPNAIPAYMEIVKKAGYTETCEFCTIFRRPGRRETMPLLGEERARASETTLIE